MLKRAASKAELEKLEFVRDELNQVIELYKRAKRDEGNSVLSDVLRGLQEFKRRKYDFNISEYYEHQNIDDDGDELSSHPAPAAAVLISPLISIPQLNQVFLNLLKKLVENGDAFDPISQKRIHLTKTLHFNEHHIINGKTEFMSFKFGSLQFLNALYTEFQQSGLLESIVRKKDVREFILQEKENIIARFIGNKESKVKGNNCFTIMAKCLPGGWIFRRFPVGFLEQVAPDAYCGNHYVWTPTLCDPKIEIVHGEWSLQCTNLPSWLTICNMNTLTGVPPSLESARYILQLNGTYRRFGELRTVTASIPLCVQKVE